jgi:rfaE bifunctional protein nucleotidyltransferase chain/domain
MQNSQRIIVLGADHNGVRAKAYIKPFLKQDGYHCIDLGPHEDRHSVDYADYARQLALIIKEGDADWGILICGTGVGMSITANKVPSVRAALAHNLEAALKSREHNDANVLCLGAWINDEERNLELVRAWLGQEFGEYRHVRRVEKISPDPAKKVVFANGVFDILHSGHIQLLKFAKSLGDYLVVGLNSDRSVKALKGPERPINCESDRKAVLESLRYVDEVVVFDELKPTDLIKTLNPTLVIKGGEWTAEEVRVRDEIPAHVGVKVCPLAAGFSTTGIIEHVRKG